MTDQQMIDLHMQGIKVHPMEQAARRRTCLERLAELLRARGLI